MTTDPVAAIEYESMIFGRHLSGITGRTRRAGGTLDQSAYMLLSVLHAAGPRSIGEFSQITGLDASTLNRQTAALVRAGYADRIADPDGGVARKFVVTDLGVELVTEERGASREALAQIIADWPAEDREAFGSLLKRINRAIEQRSGRAWPRPTA